MRLIRFMFGTFLAFFGAIMASNGSVRNDSFLLAMGGVVMVIGLCITTEIIKERIR